MYVCLYVYYSSAIKIVQFCLFRFVQHSHTHTHKHIYNRSLFHTRLHRQAIRHANVVAKREGKNTFCVCALK